MKREKIKEVIFTKNYDYIVNGIRVSDLPENLLPTDIIDIEKHDRYYSENNSWDDNSVLKVYRERDETDEEMEKRKQFWLEKKEESRKDRYDSYLKLKKEFETNQ